MFNGLNRRQLDSLSIKSVLDLTVYDSPVESKFPCENYLNVPIPKEDVTSVVDLDSVCLHLYQEVVQRKNRVLIVCIDGDSFSPAIAIAFLKFMKR